jgi:hypothetical protein
MSDGPKLIDLFDGLEKGLINYEGGYITTSFFDTRFNYVHLETVRYESVKNVYVEDDGCIFQTDGKKMYLLYEPKEYTEKHIEPTFRSDDYRIPYRFDELATIRTTREDKVMIGKEPLMSRNSFTIAKPSKRNFAIYSALEADDKHEVVLNFYREVLHQDLRITGPIQDKILKEVDAVLSKFRDFE